MQSDADTSGSKQLIPTADDRDSHDVHTSSILLLQGVGDEGTEHIADSTVKESLSKIGAADSGAVLPDSSRTDPLLAIVLTTWARLSAEDRAAIVATVRTMIDQ